MILAIFSIVLCVFEQFSFDILKNLDVARVFSYDPSLQPPIDILMIF
jgi:hypothetical protein